VPVRDLQFKRKKKTGGTDNNDGNAARAPLWKESAGRSLLRSGSEADMFRASHLEEKDATQGTPP